MEGWGGEETVINFWPEGQFLVEHSKNGYIVLKRYNTSYTLKCVNEVIKKTHFNGP